MQVYPPRMHRCIVFTTVKCLKSLGPSITLSDHSTSDPVVTNGSNYTFYQEFVTESNAHDLNISWSRTPNELDPSSGSFEYVNNNTVKASLSLWNITLTDNGEYTVKASNNCTSKKAVFDLYVYICEQDTPPQPLTQYTVTVIAEPEVPTILNLTVEFRGTLSCAFYVTDWRFDGSQLCLEGSNTSKFSCDRTMMNSTDCSFLANLWIMGPTHVDSGLYTVRTIGGQPSSTSTVDLRECKLFCWLKNDKITCSNCVLYLYNNDLIHIRHILYAHFLT